MPAMRAASPVAVIGSAEPIADRVLDGFVFMPYIYRKYEPYTGSPSRPGSCHSRMSSSSLITEPAAERLDPFTLEIVQEGLIAIADEMFVTTQRTSQSTIIYEVLDFAVGLTDGEGALITQGNGVTLFLGTLGQGVRSSLERFGRDGIRDGDILLTNDPYGGGGTHLSDVTILMPVFYDGELVSFAINKAHWTEVGGKDPGSVSTNTTEIFQEGLQFPVVKLYDRGEPSAAVFDLIAANVRTPTMSIGDLHAQIASVRLAAARFRELGDKHGIDLVRASIARMREKASELTRRELAQLPAGTYEAEDFIDADANGGPYRIRAKVRVSEDAFVCDFTGTHAQLDLPMNCTRTALNSAVQMIFKALTGPTLPLNEGCFDRLEVICPDRTVFTAERPAPVSTYWEVLVLISDLVWKALAEAVPDRTTAGHFLSLCCDLIAGPHPDTGELFILFEPNAGGWGAGRGKDGERALVSIGDGETYMIPIEVAEQKYGVVIEQYRLNTTGGGAGQWRGGEGIVKDFRITAETVTVTGIVGRHEFPAWGAAGGESGSRNEFHFIFADGRPPEVTGMVSGVTLHRGDVVRVVTGSGGGWGDPLQRDPEAVASDVRNGFVTVADAESVYGVLVDPATGELRGVTAARA
jgi:N-methylhydantoinase B